MAQSKGVGFGKKEDGSAIPKGTFYFLGIGINKYAHWSKLYNAVNDMEMIARLLEKRYGFEPSNMKMLKDEQATRANIINHLYGYTRPNALSENDSLLIYYSGHGYLDESQNGYWAPVDAQMPEVDISSLIHNSIIRDQVKSMKCRHVLLVSDSCFSGSLILKSGPTPAIESLVASDLVKRPSRRILTSGGQEPVSDGSGNNSPFAAAIISELKANSRPLLLSDELFRSVRGGVRANASQMPEFELLYGAGDLGGRFVFVLGDSNWEVLVNQTPEKEHNIGATRSIEEPPSPPDNKVPPELLAQQQKELTAMVSSGNSDKAIKQLLDFTSKYELDISDEVVQLSGRLSMLQRQELQGIISFSDALIERNKINSALLQLLRRLS